MIIAAVALLPQGLVGLPAQIRERLAGRLIGRPRERTGAKQEVLDEAS